MADFPMCRLTSCTFSKNCRRHWHSGTQEEVYGQQTISHHPKHTGHTEAKQCLGYVEVDPKFKPSKARGKKRGKDLE